MTWARHLAVGTLVLAAVAPVAGAVVETSNLDRQRDLQQQLDATTEDVESAQEQLATVQSQRKAADAQLATVNAKVAEATVKVDLARAESQRLAAAVAITQAHIAQTQLEIDKATADAKQSALLLYKQTTGDSMVGLLRGTTGVARALEGSRYLSRVGERRRSDLQKMARAKAELAAEQAKLADQQKSADAARAEADDEKARLDALQAQQAAASATLAARAQQESSLVASLRAKQDTIYAALDATNAQISRDLANLGGNIPNLGTGRFVRPVPGPVTSAYGSRIDPISGQPSFHPGLDLGSPCGTPIKAADAGMIFSAGPNGGYGNLTVLLHSASLATAYGHQSQIIVTKGQVVSKGQVIGYVGTTGYSTGCHLHFEVRINGNTTNPIVYL